MIGQSHIYQDTFSSQSDDEEFIIPLDALKLILLKALSWYFVHEHMSKQTKRAKIPLKVLPFMKSSLPKLFNCGNLEADQFRSNLSDATNRIVVDEYSERLDVVLKAWNFKRIPVAGDGNCLFYAVAHALLQKDNSAMMTTLVERLACKLDISQIELARLLRQATVDEWLGENSSLYQSFLTENQLQREAHKFLQDGHYSGDMGDLVLPALVNVICQPVTIFTSAENLPVITLLPMTSIVIDSPFVLSLQPRWARTL